jgi:hypothetical protein
MVAAVVCAGCAVTRPCFTDRATPDVPEVAVRFVAPSEPTPLVDRAQNDWDARLVVDDSFSGLTDSGYRTGTWNMEPFPYHVVLWGGAFDGNDVTYRTVPLAPGPYMFGLLDQDNETAYQGWISVNYGGDDVLDLLTEWRDTVADQKKWLGFENKIEGKLSSRDASHFKQFQKDLRNIERLENRIDRAIKQEKWSNKEHWAERVELIQNAEVLLMPGEFDFFRPSTQPAFRDAELASIRSGDVLTKVVLLADYAQSLEKWQRINDLREDLERYRGVLVEEVKRLERLQRFYAMTDHLYNHGKRFVRAEQRLQETRGMIDRVDRQITNHRRHCHALMFVSGLFAPDEAFQAFEDQRETLLRKRIVLQEQKRLLDRKFSQASRESQKRIMIERERQDLIGQFDVIDTEIRLMNEAKVALNQLRNTTEVIHRHGPARIVTATLVDDRVPAYLVDALERESLMTVRLQSADTLYTPPAQDVASTQKATMKQTSFRTTPTKKTTVKKTTWRP